MATYDWPSDLIPRTASIGLQRNTLLWRSQLNGNAQVVDLLGERWKLSFVMPPARRRDAGRVEMWLMRLTGGIDRVNLWHFARPQPRGTMRGTPTLVSTVTRGANSLDLQGLTPGATLLGGDMIGLAGQLFMSKQQTLVADGVGALTVPLINRVRATITAGEAVIWDRPKATFLLPAQFNAVSFAPGLADPIAFDLEEVF